MKKNWWIFATHGSFRRYIGISSLHDLFKEVSLVGIEYIQNLRLFLSRYLFDHFFTEAPRESLSWGTHLRVWFWSTKINGNLSIWMFPKMVVPQKWMVYMGKPYSNGWFGGYPYFRKHPYISPFFQQPRCLAHHELRFGSNHSVGARSSGCFRRTVTSRGFFGCFCWDLFGKTGMRSFS